MTRGDLEGCKYEFMIWVVEEGIEMKDPKIEVHEEGTKDCGKLQPYQNLTKYLSQDSFLSTGKLIQQLCFVLLLPEIESTYDVF
jgi:hypothetical protein